MTNLTKLKTLTVLLLLLMMTVVPGYAQIPEESTNPDPSQAEADYRFQFDRYRTSYNDYLVTKSEYLKSGSLKAEQEALAAAKVTAVYRAEVLRTYNRWMMLQLLQYQTPFPQVIESVGKLTTQFNWYLDHKAKIEAAVSVAAFEEVMAEYVSEQKNRDKVYAMAQVDLKLAKIAFFQQQARSLYDPILVVLQGKTNIAEVEQGLVKVADLGQQINDSILEARTKAGAIESGDLEVFQALRQTSERLELMRSRELTLINTMMELETRYVR